MALSYIKKKYTNVIPITIAGSASNTFTTISHVGGVNSNGPSADDTITLGNCDPDGMLIADMALYQFFRISGVSFKIFFPEGSDVNNTSCQWSMGYSANQIIKPDLDFKKLQTLQTYQTGGCDSGRPVTRYFKTLTTLKRLGIEWCNTREISNFKPALVSQQQPLYGGQLPVNAGSSTNIKFFRSDAATATGQIARIQVTYYVQYKGTKGNSSLIS